MRLRLLIASGLNPGLLSKISLPILLQQLTPQGSTLENGLDEVVLLQGLGQVFVHLGLDALLTVTHHGVGCQGNDRGTMRAKASLILANLASCLKAALPGGISSQSR